MTSPSYLPENDTELTQWLTNFNTVAAANLTTLKLTLTDLEACKTDTATFNASITDADAAKQAAKHKTQTKTAARASVTSDARALARRIQGTPGIPDTLKQQLGLTVPGPRRRVVPVFVPQNLQAKIQPTSQILLTWETGGNEPGALYWIERKCEETGTWTAVNSVTATRLLDDGCTPGVQTFYRLCAKRGNRVSPMSMEAVVY